MFHIKSESSRVAQVILLALFLNVARCNRHVCQTRGSGTLQPSVLHFVRDVRAQSANCRDTHPAYSMLTNILSLFPLDRNDAR